MFIDDVSSIVIDMGTDTTWIGYAGEDTPKTVDNSVSLFKQSMSVFWLRREDEEKSLQDKNWVIIGKIMRFIPCWMKMGMSMTGIDLSHTFQRD